MVMLGGMFIGGMISGSKYQDTVDQIQKQTNAINDTTNQLNSEYSALMGDFDNYQRDYKDNITKYQTLQDVQTAQLNVLKAKYNAQQFTTRIMGITLAASVFFILLLKLFLPAGGMVTVLKNLWNGIFGHDDGKGDGEGDGDGDGHKYDRSVGSSSNPHVNSQGNSHVHGDSGKNNGKTHDWWSLNWI